jgi:hypothetical protein
MAAEEGAMMNAAAREAVPPHIAELAAESGLGAPLGVFTKGLSDGSLFSKYSLTCVFENGCIRGNPDNAKTDMFRWDEVDAFVRRIVRKETQYGHHRSTVHTYEFTMGKRLVPVVGVTTPNQTTGLEGFADLVDPLVTRHQLPKMEERLDRGDRVRFGVFGVQPDGVWRETLFGSGKVLPWPEVAGVDVEDGKVVVLSTTAKRPWYRSPVGDTPNLLAFRRLVMRQTSGN